MCGRYTVFREVQEIRARWNVLIDEFLYKRTYNAAPSRLLPVISTADPAVISFYRWGLIPSWAKDMSLGARMINARAETLMEKPSFRTLIKSRRCLVLTNGFYEWKDTVHGKQPYFITLRDTGFFTFAGLWDRWKQNGEDIFSFTIITVAANEQMQDIQHRMPVILPAEAELKWLDPSLPPEVAMSLLKPYSAGEMTVYPVSKAVNNAATDDVVLISAISLP